MPDQTLVSDLVRRAATKPQAVLPLLSRNGHHTLEYRELLQEALKFAAFYRSAGACRNHLIMIFLPTHRHMFSSFFGAMLIGAIPTYMPPPSPKQDPDLYWQGHQALFERSLPHLLVTNSVIRDQMIHNRLDINSSVTILDVAEIDSSTESRDIVFPESTDLALLQHSSGTTGLKKGVMLTYGAIESQLSAYTSSVAACPNDVLVSWLPVYHDMGLVACTLMPLMLGATVIVLDPFEWSTNPISLVHAIAKYHGTLVWLPNFAFEHLVRGIPKVDDTFDLASVRAFINCSEPCKPATFRRFVDHFFLRGARTEQLQVCYAMAETVFAVTQTVLGRPAQEIVVSERGIRDEGVARSPEAGEATVSLLSAGKPIHGMSIRFEAAPLGGSGYGAVGEVVVSGSSLFGGYYRLPEITKERFINHEYYTSDLGFIFDGELYILGRKDDLIIVHGKNFYAHEIEALVSEMPGVKPGRTVAFGVDNPLSGSLDLVVVAELNPEFEGNVEIRRIKEILYQEVGVMVREAFLVPQGWLVKTSSGKVSRFLNREKCYKKKRHVGYPAEGTEVMGTVPSLRRLNQ